MISGHKFSLGEGCILVKDVVVRNWIKMVSNHASIFLLNLIFDDKCHVTEGQRKVFFKDQPVVVVAIDSVACVDGHGLPVSLKGLDCTVVVKSSDGASLLYEVGLLLCDDVGESC